MPYVVVGVCEAKAKFSSLLARARGGLGRTVRTSASPARCGSLAPCRCRHAAGHIPRDAPAHLRRYPVPGVGVPRSAAPGAMGLPGDALHSM